MKKRIKDYISYFVGSLIYSLSVTIFISPNKISPGGLTGIATLVNFLFTIPTGLVVFILNIPVLIIGFKKFGRYLIVNSTLVTVLISFLLTLTEQLMPTIVVDKILAAVFGGGLMGLGISIIMRHGATTGGVDIIAKLINRRFRHITVGKIILFLDATVILLAIIVYKNIESSLYSITTMFVSSRIMDSFLYGSDKGKLIQTVTTKAPEICNALFRSMQRGVTILDVKGGYTGEEKKMLFCSVRPYEVNAIYDIIEKYDPNAFIIVSEVGEIIGEGFKRFN